MQDFDALIIPGGVEVAKNHCSFAFAGVQAEIRPDVAAFVRDFFEAHKPVGAIGIAPALVALALHARHDRAALTLGNDAGVAEAITQLGQQYMSTPSAKEVVIDEAHKRVTTPAYMFDEASLSDVFIGITRGVAEVLRRL